MILFHLLLAEGLSALVPEQVPEGSQGNSATREFVIVNLGISC